MSRPNRLVLLLALLLVVPFAACGTAEEPVENAAESMENAAENAADATENAAENAADAMEGAAEEVAEETGPAQPELVGEIRTSGENLEWGTPTQETAPYTWSVQVTNDTTAALDITVRFQLLDQNDGVIKTETATVRLQPAQSRTIRENGSMPYARANDVYSYSAVTDFEIVES